MDEVLAELTRKPQQKRSRETLERAVSAARSLLIAKGYEGLTLQDVAAVAEISVGAIYGRVKNKEDLVRLVHLSVIEEMAEEEQVLFAHKAWAGKPLNVLVPSLINTYADFLRDHAPVLRPIMLRAVSDAFIAETGHTAYQGIFDRIVELFLLCRDEIRHADPLAAAQFCQFTAYSVLKNRLGLGSTLGEQQDQNWPAFKGNLVNICLIYLTSGSH